jgi:hypothetical protein
VASNSLSSNLPWELANSRWAASLNPLIKNPLINGYLLTNIKLDTGANVINHRLQRRLRGYLVVMNDSPETFCDSQSDNQTPDLTLVLNASGPATVTLYVF